MAVDREFACILLMCIKFCDLLVSFDCLWNSFCSPWDQPWGRFGLPRGPPWRHFGPPLGSLGIPWGHLGHVGLPRGAWDDLGSKMDVNSVTLRNSAPNAAYTLRVLGGGHPHREGQRRRRCRVARRGGRVEG